MTIPTSQPTQRRRIAPPTVAAASGDTAIERPQPIPWRINDLTDHSRQRELIPPVSDGEIDALAASMASQGLKYPIEITPTGVIIIGHQRVAAAKKLGWSFIPAIVRYDLAEAGEVAIVTELIRDNLDRRQMTDLQVARMYSELRDLAKKSNEVRGTGNLRDELSKRFGGRYSGRTLDRLRELLVLPIEFQQLIDGGQLTQQMGGRLVKLGRDQLDQAAAKIRDGGDLKKLIAGLLQHDAVAGNVDGKATRYRKVLAVLNRDLPILAGDVDQIVGRGGANSRTASKVIQDAIKILSMLKKAEMAMYARTGTAVAERVREIQKKIANGEPGQIGQLINNADVGT